MILFLWCLLFSGAADTSIPPFVPAPIEWRQWLYYVATDPQTANLPASALNENEKQILREAHFGEADFTTFGGRNLKDSAALELVRRQFMAKRMTDVQFQSSVQAIIQTRVQRMKELAIASIVRARDPGRKGKAKNP